MNTKTLTVAFAAISIAALIVSSFAVFAVARTYSASLARECSEGVSEDITPPEISASLPAESHIDEETTPPESESETSSTQTEPPETTLSDSEALPPKTTENPVAQTEAAPSFTLSLSGDRLMILSPDGGSVYERIIDADDLHPKDREALLTGIAFPDLSGAMSAVYDLIS